MVMRELTFLHMSRQSIHASKPLATPLPSTCVFPRITPVLVVRLLGYGCREPCRSFCIPFLPLVLAGLFPGVWPSRNRALVYRVENQLLLLLGNCRWED